MVTRTAYLSEMRGMALAMSAWILSVWAVIRWSWFSTLSSILCNRREFKGHSLRLRKRLDLALHHGSLILQYDW